MSLEHAVLGFLSHKAFSGYDLKKAFDAVTPHFWPADQSQIYRALGQLRKRGWAQQEIVHQERRPNRKVYRITAEGRQEFRRWLTSFTLPEEIREAALVPILFAGGLQEEAALTLLQGHAERLRRRLGTYRRLHAQNREQVESVCPAEGLPFWRLTLEHQIVVTEATLEWIEGIIQGLRPGEDVSSRTRMTKRSGEAARASFPAPAQDHAPSRGRRDGRKPWES